MLQTVSRLPEDLCEGSARDARDHPAPLAAERDVPLALLSRAGCDSKVGCRMRTDADGGDEEFEKLLARYPTEASQAIISQAWSASQHAHRRPAAADADGARSGVQARCVCQPSCMVQPDVFAQELRCPQMQTHQSSS